MSVFTKAPEDLQKALREVCAPVIHEIKMMPEFGDGLKGWGKLTMLDILSYDKDFSEHFHSDCFKLSEKPFSQWGSHDQKEAAATIIGMDICAERIMVEYFITVTGVEKIRSSYYGDPSEKEKCDALIKSMFDDLEKNE